MNAGGRTGGSKVRLILILALLHAFAAASAAGLAQAPVADQDSASSEQFNAHLRRHFEDIHEVSMRFHMTDPQIGGLIVLRMVWEGGHLSAGEVIENETGSLELAAALLDSIGEWEIPALSGPVTLSTSFRIRLVGSDHPDFPGRALLTGSVQDPLGRRLGGARITFEPAREGLETVPAARANREGVFVRTLIPPGSWDVLCTHEGFEPVRLAVVQLRPGEHRIVHFTLKPVVSR